MSRIFLIGYMGAGKTTLGKLLAKYQKLEFVDLDHYIESRYQKTIPQIFSEQGEDEFRSIEKDMLHEVGSFENIIISTGGGVPCFFDNMDYMCNQGITIYLKASAETLANRLSLCKNKRPLIKDKAEDELLSFIKKTLNQRELYYNKAHIIFEAEDFKNYSDGERITKELNKIINER